jgi:hypothetical protein
MLLRPRMLAFSGMLRTPSAAPSQCNATVALGPHVLSGHDGAGRKAKSNMLSC